MLDLFFLILFLVILFFQGKISGKITSKNIKKLFTESFPIIYSKPEYTQIKDELIKMSNDDTQRELYEMRAKTLRDKISALNEAERKGIKKGREEGRKEGEQNKAIEIAKSLINLGLDKESIAKSTGLDLCEVEKLMN